MATTDDEKETREKAQDDYERSWKRTGPFPLWELFGPSAYNPPSDPELKLVYDRTWEQEKLRNS